MQRLLISTIIRKSPPDQPSGCLYTFDLNSEKCVQQSKIIEPPHREKDTNLRGGIRGLRGIAVREDQVILANATEIFRYDPNWQLLGRFSHPSCGSIHDIAIHHETIWVTSSRNDLLMQFDMSGSLKSYHDLRHHSNLFSEVSWKSVPFLSEEQIRSGAVDFRNPASHNHHASDSVHLNGIDVTSDGHLIISCGMLLNNRISSWLRLKNWMHNHAMWQVILDLNHWLKIISKKDTTSANKLIFHPASAECAVVEIDQNKNFLLRFHFKEITVPAHSIRILEDGSAVYLNTEKGEILHLDLKSNKIISSTCIGKGFLRGVRQLSDGSLILGDKQTLIRFDVVDRKIISQFIISENSNEAVYDINLLPDHFNLPPKVFE